MSSPLQLSFAHRGSGFKPGWYNLPSQARTRAVERESGAQAFQGKFCFSTVKRDLAADYPVNENYSREI
jgi:hypothetical protein